MTWKPRTFLALLVAGMGCWLERQAAAQIEYLKAENRLLRSRLGRRRIVFTDAERSTLATLAKEIGTKALRALDPIVSPATLLRWHRELVALKWTFLERRQPGRPRTTVDIEHLIVRIAIENPGWGYTRIQGALRNLELNIGRGTIRRILKDHLIEPAPARGRRIPWSVFLRSCRVCGDYHHGEYYRYQSKDVFHDNLPRCFNSTFVYRMQGQCMLPNMRKLGLAMSL